MTDTELSNLIAHNLFRKPWARLGPLDPDATEMLAYGYRNFEGTDKLYAFHRYPDGSFCMTVYINDKPGNVPASQDALRELWQAATKTTDAAPTNEVSGG